MKCYITELPRNGPVLIQGPSHTHTHTQNHLYRKAKLNLIRFLLCEEDILLPMEKCGGDVWWG